MDLQGRHVTHPSLHIKTAHDAHVLFEAVRQGHLPMIRRRLSGGERAQLRSGDVFVWEEAAHKGGLERWTDGRKWSASRMREPFLFYEEKVARKGPYDYNSNSPLPSPSLPGVPSPSPFSPNGSPSSNFQHFSHSADVGSGGLTKQTYSAWVTFPSPDGTIPDPATAYRKKWHMTAYFSSADFASLPSVQDDSLLRTIRVPHGMYETGKGLMRKAPSKESRPPPPSPVAYGDGGYAIPGPYVYTPGPGPHPYLPSGVAPTGHGHGHGHLRYLNDDDHDDAMSVDGDSYSYPRERERAMSTSSASRAGTGGYYGAGSPLPPPIPPYDPRHQYQLPRFTAGRSSSYDQHYYEQQRHYRHAYDDRDQERDCREPYVSHAPRRYGSPGSPGSRSPNEDDEDEFGRDNRDGDDDMRSSSGITSPPPLPRSHYRSSSRRREGHSGSTSATSSPTSASSSARYYGAEAPGMGISRSATRTMGMSLTLPPPPLLPNNHGQSGSGSSDGELTPPATILTPPISASSASGAFPPGVRHHHQPYHHHSQNHAHGEHYHHQHGSSTSPRRERERERERDNYYGSSQPYAQHYAHAGGNSSHPYYAPAPIRTNSGMSGPTAISSIRTGAGGADQNGDVQQDYFPFVSAPPSGPSPTSGRAAPSSSSPITASTKEASYPSPPPERGLGSGNGNGGGGSSGSSSQSDRERAPSIGALASGSGGNSASGAYRSAEDRKVLGAFRVAL